MKKEKKLHIGIIIIGTIIFIMTCFHTNVHNDQAYTMGVNNLSIREEISALIEDVHPILYYMMLRGFTAVFGNTAIWCRIFSLFPIVILGIIRIYSY